MQQNLNEEEEKTGKMKEEMEVEVKLYHDKQDRLTRRVEALANDLEEAKQKTEVAKTERDAKSVEIKELKEEMDQVMSDSQRIQEKQTQQENVPILLFSE